MCHNCFHIFQVRKEDVVEKGEVLDGTIRDLQRFSIKCPQCGNVFTEIFPVEEVDV